MHHLKNPQSKILRDNYTLCARILTAVVPGDAILPHTQVWHLLTKKSEIHVIHKDLIWESVGQLSDKIKGPCFLCISLLVQCFGHVWERVIHSPLDIITLSTCSLHFMHSVNVNNGLFPRTVWVVDPFTSV